MRYSILSLSCSLVVAILFTNLHTTSSHPITLDQAEIVEIVPANDKESIDESPEQLSERNKRMIETLRMLFPGLAQMIDKKIEDLARYLFGIIGRVVLEGGLFGGGGSSDDSSSRSSSNGGSRVSVSLPTFPPDEDDDDDDDDDDSNSNSSSLSANIVATFQRDGSDGGSATTTESTATTDPTAETTADDNENALSGAESNQNEVRIAFNQNAASSDNAGPQPSDDLSDVGVDEENRNKRFLSFGGSASTSSSSGGGSGNFLFDIIRSTADRAARAAGTVYRVIAGTDSLNVGLTATSQQQTLNPSPNLSAGFFQKLVAGSGSSESADEQENSAQVSIDGSAKAEGGLQEGIPGPITRLFVIANRGISNLVQDLILRLAQTSERLVNFKARLITSLI